MSLHLHWQKIRHRPIVILTACLVVGIFCADMTGRSIVIPASLLLLVGTVLAFIRTPHWISMSGILLAIIGLGALLHGLQITPPHDDVMHLAPAKLPVLRGQVIAQGGAGANWSTCTCQVREVVLPSGQTAKVTGRIRVYIDTALAPGNGEQVEFYDIALKLPVEPSNWGQTNQRQRLARQRIFCIASVKNWTPLNLPQGFLSQVMQTRIATVSLLQKLMERAGGADQAALVTGMVFGNEVVSVDVATEELFRKTGTIHLLVVSGAQVSTVVLLLLFLTRVGRHPGWLHFLYIGPLLIWFGLVTGMGASVLRSLVMAAIGLICAITGRKYDFISAMALAALWVLLADTANLFSMGAQLTFLATLGVYALLPPERVDALGDRIYSPMPVVVARCTLGAWLMTVPLLVHGFHETALLGNIANLVVVPLSAVIVVVGLLTTLLGLISPVVVLPLCWVCKWLAVFMVVTVQWASNLPFAFLTNLYLPGWGVWVWLVVAGTLIYLINNEILTGLWRNHRGALLTACAVFCAFVCMLFIINCLVKKPVGVTFFDVGEGQCAVVETGTGQVILVDGGGRCGISAREIARSILYPWLLQRGYRELAAVIITHPDYDHFGAAAELTRDFPVRLVITNGDSGAGYWARWMADLQSRKTDIRIAGAGDMIKLAGADAWFIWPEQNGSYQNRNDKSLVFLMDIKGLRLLFTGDAETDALNSIAASYNQRLQSLVVQVPHHGLDSAKSLNFAQATNACLAVVSRGSDNTGRGGEQAFLQAGSQVCTTGVTGAVHIFQQNGATVWRTFHEHRTK